MPLTAAFVLPHPPIILPEIGKGQEKKIKITSAACDECGKKIAELKPDLIILSSPHAPMYADDFYVCEPGEELDHGAIVPLYFVNRHYNEYGLLRISPCGLSLREHYDFGRQIIDSIEEKNAVFIASGDWSHKLKADGPYGFAKEGVEFDEIVTNALAIGDFKKIMNIDERLTEEAAQCGIRPLSIMAGALSRYNNITLKLLSYENTFGVGYAVAEYIIN